jgi:hypothetical protein
MKAMTVEKIEEAIAEATELTSPYIVGQKKVNIRVVTVRRLLDEIKELRLKVAEFNSSIILYGEDVENI